MPMPKVRDVVSVVNPTAACGERCGRLLNPCARVQGTTTTTRRWFAAGFARGCIPGAPRRCGFLRTRSKSRGVRCKRAQGMGTRCRRWIESSTKSWRSVRRCSASWRTHTRTWRTWRPSRPSPPANTSTPRTATRAGIFTQDTAPTRLCGWRLGTATKDHGPQEPRGSPSGRDCWTRNCKRASEYHLPRRQR